MNAEQHEFLSTWGRMYRDIIARHQVLSMRYDRPLWLDDETVEVDCAERGRAYHVRVTEHDAEVVGWVEADDLGCPLRYGPLPRWEAAEVEDYAMLAVRS